MSYSQGFKINVNKLNADDALLCLLEITHPFLAEPIRLVNDSDDLYTEYHKYVKMPFTLKRQDDVQGELPKVTLTITNVGRSLVKWIDSSGGGNKATIKVILTRRASLIFEEEIEFGIATVSVTGSSIGFSLIIQNNLVKRGIRFVYDQNHAPGLF